jgi:HSP20 family protein
MLARRDNANLRRWSDPMFGMLDSMRELQNSMAGLFGDLSLGAAGAEAVPRINAYRQGEDMVIECSMPGVKKDDVDISLENDILTLRGRTHENKDVKEEQYHIREMREGSFQRSLQLPFDVDPEKVNAKFEDGMLRVTVTPSERSKRRSIKVNVE